MADDHGCLRALPLHIIARWPSLRSLVQAIHHALGARQCTADLTTRKERVRGGLACSQGGKTAIISILFVLETAPRATMFPELTFLKVWPEEGVTSSQHVSLPSHVQAAYPFLALAWLLVPCARPAEHSVHALHA